jgi:hypothetical protein
MGCPGRNLYSRDKTRGVSGDMTTGIRRNPDVGVMRSWHGAYVNEVKLVVV